MIAKFLFAICNTFKFPFSLLVRLKPWLDKGEACGGGIDKDEIRVSFEDLCARYTQLTVYPHIIYAVHRVCIIIYWSFFLAFIVVWSVPRTQIWYLIGWHKCGSDKAIKL